VPIQDRAQRWEQIACQRRLKPDAAEAAGCAMQHRRPARKTDRRRLGSCQISRYVMPFR